MFIDANDIVLKRVTIQDIELIRNWRNSSEVAAFMEHREYITYQQQQEWFNKIDTNENLFFLISIDNKPLGLIYGAGIDWENNIVSNAGIFIAKEDQRENRFALNASILVNDFAFYIGIEEIYAKILKDNTKAKVYNSLLGYKILPGQDMYNQKYKLCKSDYDLCRRNLSQKIKLPNEFRIGIQGQIFLVEIGNVNYDQVASIRRLISVIDEY